MSINALFQPNDYVLYAKSFNGSGSSSFEAPVTVQGDAISASQLSIVSQNIQNTDINLGNQAGYWTIQRTGNNQELAIFQNGNSINTNLSLLLGTGILINNSNMSLNGAFRDTHNVAGTAGQVLTSTGTATQWASNESQIFLNSNGVALDGGYISQTTFTNTGANASYSFARNTTVVGFYVQIDAAAGANSWIFTLQKNGVNAGMSATLTGTTTSFSATGSVSYNAGDNFTMAITKGGAPPAVSSCFVTILYR